MNKVEVNKSVAYNAPGHFDMRAIRLHGPDNDCQAFSLGMSHFLPGGGTAYVEPPVELVYFILDGELTVLDKEKDEKHIFDLASGGFSSTVRLAKSSADMWVPILTQNHDNVLQVMDTYIEKMKAFREAVADYDEDKIRELINEANKIKKILR